MMTRIKNCQLPGYSRIAEENQNANFQFSIRYLKRILARPWNYNVKPAIKRAYRWFQHTRNRVKPSNASDIHRQVSHLQTGDTVRVRSRDEIAVTLDAFSELKGCAFLDYMWEYCGSTQKVLQAMEQFLDERDYKVKKVRGVVLLEGVHCHGTPVFGRCDRRCYLFWREEWLEKLMPD